MLVTIMLHPWPAMLVHGCAAARSLICCCTHPASSLNNTALQDVVEHTVCGHLHLWQAQHPLEPSQGLLRFLLLQQATQEADAMPGQALHLREHRHRYAGRARVVGTYSMRHTPQCGVYTHPSYQCPSYAYHPGSTPALSKPICCVRDGFQHATIKQHTYLAGGQRLQACIRLLLRGAANRLQAFQQWTQPLS